MKNYRLIEWLFVVVWWLIALSISGLLMTSCSRIHYVPVESIKTEYVDRVKRDSLYIRDSLIIREKGDTVWLTRWRTEYRDRLLRDSIIIRDSVRVPYPVERPLTKWQSVKMDMGGIAMGGVIALLCVLITWIIISIRKRKM